MIKAIIFDMDGVISDTQKIHASVEQDIFKQNGINLSVEEITAKYSGVEDHEFFKEIFSDYNVTANVEDIIKKKWINMFSTIEKSIEEIPGTINLIKDCKSKGMKLAVASASPTCFIKLVLEKLNIANQWDAITSAEEVKKGKPDPAVFLLAAKKIGVEPNQCLVIEDGINGMIAAKKAGMKCIGLVKEGKQCPADKIIHDLRNLSWDIIINLF